MANKQGFTLLEVIVVIAVVGILVMFSMPRITTIRNLAIERVCSNNKKNLEVSYLTFLTLKNLNHTEATFEKFILDNFDEICPKGGHITYVEEKVKCSKHQDKENNPDKELPTDGVPWLYLHSKQWL